MIKKRNDRMPRFVLQPALLIFINIATSTGATTPTVKTDYVNYIDHSSAKLHGSAVEGESITSYGFVWSEDQNLESTLVISNSSVNTYEVASHSPGVNASLINSYKVDLENLKHRSDIYFRSYIIENGIHYYGNIIQFITEQRDFSLFLDGDNDALLIDKYTTSNSVLRRGVNNAFSFEFWMKPQVKEEAMIILGLYNGQNEVSKLVRISYAKKLWFLNSERDLLGHDSMVDEEWTHIAFTYNGDSAIVYRDGERYLATDTFDNYTDIDGFAPANLVVGGEPSSEDKTMVREFLGHLDALRFWDIALTKEQVQYLLYDKICRSSNGGVEIVGSGNEIPNMSWANLSASFEFNVRSINGEASLNRPTRLRNQEDVTASRLPFFHENSNLNTESRAGSSPAYSYNIVSLGDSKPSPTIPRVNWRHDAIANTHWTNSESWSGFAYPGQGVPAYGYEDISSLEVEDDSTFCEYVVINKSSVQKAQVVDVPPAINVLVDREREMGTYVVTSTGQLKILSAIRLNIFKDSVLDTEDISVEIDGGYIIVENGSFEIL